MGQHEAGFVIEHPLELVVAIDTGGMGDAELLSLFIHIMLNIGQQLVHAGYDIGQGKAHFGFGVAAGYFHCAVVEVARTNGQAHGHALHLPLGKLEAGTLSIAGIHFHRNAAGNQAHLDGFDALKQRIKLAGFIDRHDDHLNRGQLGRQHKALVVRMSHHEGPHQASTHAPTGTPHVLAHAFFISKLHVERLSEVLAQKMAGTGLQGLAILHQRLNAVRVLGPGKPFIGGFYAFHHGQGHVLLGKLGVHVEYLASFGHGFFGGSVGGVALLPQKLGGAQKQAGTHFPTHHVGPLVNEQWQVAVALNPVFVSAPDNGFRCRTHNKLFLELSCRIHA